MLSGQAETDQRTMQLLLCRTHTDIHVVSLSTLILQNVNISYGNSRDKLHKKCENININL